MLELNESNFKKEVLESDIPVIVDFFASWCGPCQMMGPIFAEASKKFEGDVKFAKLSTEIAPEIAQTYAVMSIPTFIIFKAGKEVNRFIGGMPKDVLIDRVNEVFL